MSKKIEERTQVLYEYLLNYITENSYPPTVREICNALNINSTSTASYYLTYLENKGLIRRGASKSRAIELLQPINNDLVKTEYALHNTDNNIEQMQNLSPIPLIGTITAGQPILAVENHEEMYYLPSSMFKGDNLFMLTVRGESMINAGILDGDKVIIRQCDTAENGEIVAALIDDSATIKRFYKEKDRFRLQPENDNMSPMYFDDVKIIGKVVGLIRNI